MPGEARALGACKHAPKLAKNATASTLTSAARGFTGSNLHVPRVTTSQVTHDAGAPDPVSLSLQRKQQIVAVLQAMAICGAACQRRAKFIWGREPSWSLQRWPSSEAAGHVQSCMLVMHSKPPPH